MNLEDLNKQFAIIGVGNKVLVMENNPDGSIRELWPFEEFRHLLVKHMVSTEVMNKRTKEITLKTVSLADTWLRWSRGRQYDQLVYDMPGSRVKCGSKDYNGWQGFKLEPQQGNWELNKQHLYHIICGDNEEYFHWVLNWLAALFQSPGQHAMTSIVLRGGQGIGKGHFAHNMVGTLFGSQQYLHILGANQLTAEFNEHLSGKSYIFADESTWGGDPRAAAKLKGLVTEDTIPIHRKFLKMTDEPSALHIIIASNNDWPIPIERDDRRFSVLDVGESRRLDTQHFTELRTELSHGGQAAMLYDLLEIAVDRNLLGHPLNTAAKSDIAIQSLRPIEHWWFEKLESGTIGFDDRWPILPLTRAAIHASYLEFLERHHKASRERRSTETELGMFLRKFSPVTQTVCVNGKVERLCYIPPLEECRKVWIQEFKWSPAYEWDKGGLIVKPVQSELPIQPSTAKKEG